MVQNLSISRVLAEVGLQGKMSRVRWAKRRQAADGNSGECQNKSSEVPVTLGLKPRKMSLKGMGEVLGYSEKTW